MGGKSLTSTVADVTEEASTCSLLECTIIHQPNKNKITRNVYGCGWVGKTNKSTHTRLAETNRTPKPWQVVGGKDREREL